MDKQRVSEYQFTFLLRQSGLLKARNFDEADKLAKSILLRRHGEIATLLEVKRIAS